VCGDHADITEVEMKRAGIVLLIVLAVLIQCCGCGRQVLKDTNTLDFESDDDTVDYKAANADGQFSLFYNSNSTTNPMTVEDSDNKLLCGLIYENIINVDNSFKTEEGIVADWSTEDGKTWVLQLGEGHTFADGNPVEADDVVYSLQTAASNRYSRRLSGWLYETVANEDGTVSVSLKSTNYQFPALLEIPVIEYNTFQNNHPIGSGPYQFAEEGGSLIPNDFYPSSKNLPVETIYLQTFSSVDDYISKFNDSTCDLVVNDPTTSDSTSFGSATQVRSYNTTNLHFVIFNLGDSCFQDHKLQHAMSLAFDRKYMVETLMQGNALEAYTPISPASTLYNGSLKKSLSYDLDACRKELAKIGVDDYDKDGLAEYMPEGSETALELNLSFLVCSDSPAKVAMAEKFASEITSIGIKVAVKSLAWEAYQEALQNGSFDIAYCEVKLTPDFDLTCILAPGGSANYSRGYDTVNTDNINAYLSADDSDRQDACDEMCEYIAEQASIVPICFEKHQIITHSGMVSQMTVSQESPLHTFAEWKIKMGN